jgi:hypothetical protein
MRVHFVGSPVDASLVVKSAEFRANSTGKPVTSNLQSVECPTQENLQLNKTEVSPQSWPPTRQIVGKVMIVSRYLPYLLGTQGRCRCQNVLELTTCAAN